LNTPAAGAQRLNGTAHRRTDFSGHSPGMPLGLASASSGRAPGSILNRRVFFGGPSAFAARLRDATISQQRVLVALRPLPRPAVAVLLETVPPRTVPKQAQKPPTPFARCFVGPCPSLFLLSTLSWVTHGTIQFLKTKPANTSACVPETSLPGGRRRLPTAPLPALGPVSSLGPSFALLSHQLCGLVFDWMSTMCTYLTGGHRVGRCLPG